MITIAGAGVAGLACAYELARRGASVTVFEAADVLLDNPCSWFAGGMLAPWCEGETAPPEVVRLGAGASDWWAKITAVTRRVTLVVAPPRDRSELTRFSRRTEAHRWLGEVGVAELEPALAGWFHQALFFDREAHLDPRQALLDLTAAAQALGFDIRYGTTAPNHIDVDCRGMAPAVPGLRPVRGEMIVIEAPDITITRTVRLLHPRLPLYLVPCGQGSIWSGPR
jgi:glycine oxidase